LLLVKYFMFILLKLYVDRLVLNDWCITSIALQKALLLKVNFIFRSPELSDLYFLEVIKQEFLDFPVL